MRIYAYIFHIWKFIGKISSKRFGFIIIFVFGPQNISLWPSDNSMDAHFRHTTLAYLSNALSENTEINNESEAV